MINWELAAVIVAVASVPLVVSPVALAGLGRIIRSLFSWLKSDKTTCEALCWEDLFTGPLHACNGSCCVPVAGTGRYLNSVHNTPPSCYSGPFFNVLHTAWPRSRKRRIPKPQHLPLDSDYLRTDGNTLLAFVVITCPGYRSLMSSGGEGVSQGTFSISSNHRRARFHRPQPRDDIEPYLVGHIHEMASPTRVVDLVAIGLTKNEVLSIANGFPPFYRRRIVTHSGAIIDHPVLELTDVRRAGWVIAAGLSTHEPVNVYNNDQAGHYKSACERVYSTIVNAMQPLFTVSTEEAALCHLAASVIQYMNDQGTGSGVSKFIQGSRLEGCDGGVETLTQSWSAEECNFAIALFHHHKVMPLAQEEKRKLEPALLAVLAVAVNGVYSWWQYRNNIGSHIPDWLLVDSIRSGPIWLKDCRMAQ